MNKVKSEKLDLWQGRLKESDRAFKGQSEKMDERERIYNGERELSPLVPGDTKRSGGPKSTSHVRNIVFENIESQVSTAIPQPKVTARRKKDEPLAEVIEHFLRNELDRLPFEMLNDMAERTVPVQGGAGLMVEWDNRARTHDTVGELCVRLLHPKQYGPQPGIYTDIEDMDWFIVKLPSTRKALEEQYGVDLSDAGESEPGVRTAQEAAPGEGDQVTQYIGYAKNAKGGIDRYSWVNDTELEDIENYQARRQPVCAKCGRVRPLPGQLIASELSDGFLWPAEEYAPDPGMLLASGMAEREMLGDETDLGALNVFVGDGAAPEETGLFQYDGGDCPFCGSGEFTDAEQEYERVMLPIRLRSGEVVPGLHPEINSEGRAVMAPTLIPFYQPNIYPIVLQRSVSVHGQLLGSSDVDVIRDQQNTVNRIEQKIIDRLVKAGTRITLPAQSNLRMDPEDGERWYLQNPADASMIRVYDFKGDLEYELLYLAQVYEEARQILGITDSFQGRQDTTATSGKAKEFAAAQSAGRLESKRAMKNAAYAKLFETMFKFWLAYSDEPRPVSYKNSRGETEYQEFNRYDFLEKDGDGQYYWNDQFLFSCDTSAPLAGNREAMWQETRMNLQTGAFGDPAATETLILFWSKMEELHYPGAGATKQFLEERAQREAEQAQMMQALQSAAVTQQEPPEDFGGSRSAEESTPFLL